MSKYLDDTGLLRFWQKLKATFAGAPADLCAEQGKPIFDGMYIDATTHALVESAGISNRALIFEIEPNTTYVIECPVASTKRAGTFVTNAENAVATSYQTITGKDSMEITSGPTDAYLVVQVFANGDNENIALYRNYLSVDKKSDFTPYARRSELSPRDEHVPLVIGTQNASTGAWTGEADTLLELKHGQTIKYWLPFAGSGEATLNLKLADDVWTGAIPVYYRASTRMTTHLPASCIGVLTYLENVAIGDATYTGWWWDAAYYKDTDTVSRIRADSLRPVAGDTIIYGRNIVLEDGDGVFRSITRSNSTNTSHTCATQGFKNPAEMFYYSYSSNVAVGATMATNYMFSAYNALDFRYNSNCAQTLTKNRPIYLVFEHKADGLYYLKTGAWWTQTLPTTDDGYVYVYVGHAYSTYQYNFAPAHPMYACRNGVIVPYAGKVAMKADVYTKAEVYTKTEVDALIPGEQTAGSTTYDGKQHDLFAIEGYVAPFTALILLKGDTFFKAAMVTVCGGNLVVYEFIDSDPSEFFTWMVVKKGDNNEITSVRVTNVGANADYITFVIIPLNGTVPPMGG